MAVAVAVAAAAGDGLAASAFECLSSGADVIKLFVFVSGGIAE